MAAPGRKNSVFTDEERGDTLRTSTRLVGRIVLVGVIVLGVGGVLLAGSGVSLSGLRELTSTAETAAATDTADTADTADGANSDDVQEADYIAQTLLVAAEDSTLSAVAKLGAAGLPASPVQTLILPARAAGYTAVDLETGGALVRVSDTIFELRKRVIVQRGATLTIDLPGQTIRMISDPGSFTTIVAWGGNLAINGAVDAPLTLVAWDRDLDTADTVLADGRAYIRVKDGAFGANYAAFASLGFWSGRTGGIAVTGSTEVSATANIQNTSMTALHIGLYLSAAQSVVVATSTIEDSLSNGISIGNGSAGIAISDTIVDGSGAAGITAQTATSELTLDGVTISNSRSFGLRFDGAARADGPNTGGYSVLNAAGLHILHSTVSDNQGGGVAILATNDVEIVDTEIDQSSIALSISGGSDRVSVTDSTITSRARNGVDIVDGPTGVTVTGNIISGNERGVLLRATEVDVTDNTISATTGYGVLAEGTAMIGTVSDNVISGVGPAAVDRTNSLETFTIGENDTEDWTARTELVLWADRHPLAWLWAALLLVPAVGMLFIVRRTRQQRAIRRLVESTTIALALTDKASYDARRGGFTLPTPAAAADSGTPPGGVSGAAAGSPRGPVRSMPVTPRHPGMWSTTEPSPASRSSAGPPPAAPVAPAAVSGAPRPPGLSGAPRPPGAASDAPRGGAPRGDAPRVRVNRDVASAASATGHFSSIEQLAVTAVIDAGRPIDTVARTLRVSPSAVAYWVARAKAERELMK